MEGNLRWDKNLREGQQETMKSCKYGGVTLAVYSQLGGLYHRSKDICKSFMEV
jgi:hypothetical protein